jgi:hypothetical protein
MLDLIRKKLNKFKRPTAKPVQKPILQPSQIDAQALQAERDQPAQSTVNLIPTTPDKAQSIPGASENLRPPRVDLQGGFKRPTAGPVKKNPRFSRISSMFGREK